MEIKIRLPRVPSGALGNIVGLLGLLGVVLAIGGLTGNWWWSLLAGGVVAAAMGYVAQTYAVAEKTATGPTLVAEGARSA